MIQVGTITQFLPSLQNDMVVVMPTPHWIIPQIVPGGDSIPDDIKHVISHYPALVRQRGNLK